MGGDAKLGLDWTGLPVIATVSRLLCPSATKPRPLTPRRGGSRSRGVLSGRRHGRVTAAACVRHGDGS